MKIIFEWTGFSAKVHGYRVSNPMKVKSVLAFREARYVKEFIFLRRRSNSLDLRNFFDSGNTAIASDALYSQWANGMRWLFPTSMMPSERPKRSDRLVFPRILFFPAYSFLPVYSFLSRVYSLCWRFFSLLSRRLYNHLIRPHVVVIQLYTATGWEATDYVHCCTKDK